METSSCFCVVVVMLGAQSQVLHRVNCVPDRCTVIAPHREDFRGWHPAFCHVIVGKILCWDGSQCAGILLCAWLISGFSRSVRSCDLDMLAYETLEQRILGEPICVRTLSSHCSGPFKCSSIQQGVLVTVWRLRRQIHRKSKCSYHSKVKVVKKKSSVCSRPPPPPPGRL